MQQFTPSVPAPLRDQASLISTVVRSQRALLVGYGMYMSLGAAAYIADALGYGWPKEPFSKLAPAEVVAAIAFLLCGLISVSGFLIAVAGVVDLARAFYGGFLAFVGALAMFVPPLTFLVPLWLCSRSVSFLRGAGLQRGLWPSRAEVAAALANARTGYGVQQSHLA